MKALFNIERCYFTPFILNLQVSIMLLMVNNIMNNWWVVQTKPQGELSAMENLKLQGFVVYCPLFYKEIIRGRQVKIKATSIFPRYVFIEANKTAKATIHLIRSTFGVSQLLKIGEVPIIAQASLIESIKQLEVQRGDDIEYSFVPGDVISIQSGIYQGLEGVFQMNKGHDRAVVLLNLLQQETILNINKTKLKKIS